MCVGDRIRVTVKVFEMRWSKNYGLRQLMGVFTDSEISEDGGRIRGGEKCVNQMPSNVWGECKGVG